MLNAKRILAAIFACIFIAMLCACGDKAGEKDAEDIIENEVSEKDKPETEQQPESKPEEKPDEGEPEKETPEKDETETEQKPVKEEQQQPEEKPADGENEEAPKEDIEALASKALEKMSVIPEYPEGYPTKEDVVSQYKKACEAIGWIVGTELVAYDGDYAVEAHGMKYYKVLPDCYLGEKQAGKNPDAEMLIYNKETLEAYLATLISADEARDYVLDIDYSFDVPKFIEDENGALYVLPYAFAPAGYADDSTDTFELIANDDGSYTLAVHYTTLDDDDHVKGEHVYNAKYVNVDGRWVFKDFIVVKQH